MSRLAEHIVERLTNIGAIQRGCMKTDRIVGEVDRMICDDHIPGGPTATVIERVMRAPAGNRCGAHTGLDIQSGPIYCGEPATLQGVTPTGGLAWVCERHESIMRELLPTAT